MIRDQVLNKKPLNKLIKPTIPASHEQISLILIKSGYCIGFCLHVCIKMLVLIPAHNMYHGNLWPITWYMFKIEGLGGFNYRTNVIPFRLG